MRLLYHPSLKEITVQGLLYGLSDPVRVRIYAELAQADCAMNCSAFLSNGNLKLPKSTLSQHFRENISGVSILQRVRFIDGFADFTSETGQRFGNSFDVRVTVGNVEGI